MGQENESLTRQICLDLWRTGSKSTAVLVSAPIFTRIPNTPDMVSPLVVGTTSAVLGVVDYYQQRSRDWPIPRSLIESALIFANPTLVASLIAAQLPLEQVLAWTMLIGAGNLVIFAATEIWDSTPHTLPSR